MPILIRVGNNTTRNERLKNDIVAVEFGTITPVGGETERVIVQTIGREQNYLNIHTSYELRYVTCNDLKQRRMLLILKRTINIKIKYDSKKL